MVKIRNGFVYYYLRFFLQSLNIVCTAIQNKELLNTAPYINRIDLK